MEENELKPRESISKLFLAAESLTPHFQSKEEAASYFRNKLLAISSKYNKCVNELVQSAELEAHFNEDFLEVLSLIRKLDKLEK